MKIFAYLYTDFLLDSPPDPEIWGLEVDRVYQDLGTGEKGKKGEKSVGKRPQFALLLAACQGSPPDYLLVRRLEELGDTLEEVSSAIATLESYGVEIIATEQNYTSSTATTNPSQLIQLLAQIQAEQRRRSLRQGHARNRLQTLPPPGKAPYGYRRGKDRYILDRSTAPVVKDFFERFLLFGSLRGAVRYLEKKYGKKIAVTTGRRWLTNPIYRGDTEYGNGDIIPQTHAPILSREEAAQIDRLLRRNRCLPPRTASAPRSLAGLVICQECQSHHKITRVTARRSTQEYLYVRPVSCPKRPFCKAIPYEAVLERTIERIGEDLPRAIAQIQIPTGLKDRLMAQIQRKEEILQELSQLEAEGILDEETAHLRRYKLRNEMAQLQAQLDQLPPDNLQNIAQAVSLRQFWFDLSESERRFYFREFLQQIELVRDISGVWMVQLVFIFGQSI